MSNIACTYTVIENGYQLRAGKTFPSILECFFQSPKCIIFLMYELL